MTQFTFAQLEGLWIQAGGDPRYAGIAAAVAMAESGGDSQALGHNPGSTDVGLWQINGPGGGDLKFLDPLTNVKEAIRQSHNGVDWRPWCTAYSDGACGTKGGGYSLSNSPAGTQLRKYGANVPPNFSPVSGAPTNPGSGGSGGVHSSYNAQTCAWGIDLGTFSTPQSFFGFKIPAVSAKAGFCILSKTQVRALLGGMLIGAGTMVGLWGVGVLVTFAFRKNVMHQLSAVTSSVPVAGKAGTKIAGKTSASASRSTSTKNSVIPPAGPKPSKAARSKPPMGENKRSTEKSYRKAFEAGEGE